MLGLDMSHVNIYAVKVLNLRTLNFCTHPNFLKSLPYCRVILSNNADCMNGSADPYQLICSELRSMQVDLGLWCLLGPTCCKMLGK